MTAEARNMIVKHLSRIRASQDRTEADIGDLKLRVSAIDQHFGQIQTQLGGLNTRMERFDERLSRMERRLDLVEA